MEALHDRSRRRFYIWVDGALSNGFADGIDGLEQSADEWGTVLHGDYVDDARLYSVLTQLRRLAIGVRRLEVDPRTDQARNDLARTDLARTDRTRPEAGDRRRHAPEAHR